MHSQGFFILSVSWAVAATTGGTSQTVAAQSVPDFSGVWGHPSLPGFEPPASGPGPVLNKVRVRTGPQSGRSAVTQLVGDYTNPILKRQAAKAEGAISTRSANARLSALDRNCLATVRQVHRPLALRRRHRASAPAPRRAIAASRPGHVALARCRCQCCER